MHVCNCIENEPSIWISPLVGQTQNWNAPFRSPSHNFQLQLRLLVVSSCCFFLLFLHCIMNHFVAMEQLPVDNFPSRPTLDIGRLRASFSSSSVTKTRHVITREELLRRKHFCIFLKILTDHLTKTDPSMRRQVKILVRECTRKNREGDLKYVNLTEALQVLLRLQVREKTWQHCETLTECFLASNGKSGGTIPTVIETVR